MRSLQLQAALSEFVAQASIRLQADVLSGQEVPFELASRSSRGRGSSPLYCYRPLTDAFLTQRFEELRELDGYGRAAALLDAFEALDRYLLSAGEDPARRGARRRCDTALLALLKEVFAEQTDFELRPERLESALDRLDGSGSAAVGEVKLLATLHGMTIASQELALTRGLLIAHPGALTEIPEQALSANGSEEEGRGHDEDDRLLTVFTARDLDPRAAIAQGREVVLELLRALRLFGDGRVTLGPLAWARIGAGAWETIALGRGGRPHGMLMVGPEQEDELRAFCNLVSRRAPHANEIAWALRRFELGCECPTEREAISDYLLALRVLLEPEGPSSGLLPGRLAALCATPELRVALTERMLSACALERDAIAGKPLERTATLARELADHLRALLRDVICGHLPTDLVTLADELLLSGDQLGEEVLSHERQPAQILHVAV